MVKYVIMYFIAYKYGINVQSEEKQCENNFKKKKWDCWVGGFFFVQFLLRIKRKKKCFLMQSIRNGPKKPSFHLPYLQLHSPN